MKNKQSLIIILLLSFLVLNGCQSSKEKEYNKQITLAKQFVELGNVDNAVEIMKHMELKPEDREYYGGLLKQQIEELESILNGLEIVDQKSSIDGNYMYTSGAIKNNNSKYTYSFVKVKVVFLDDNGNIVDSDWSYAVGSEGIKPNEQKYFEMMTKYRDGMKKYNVEILDFDYD